MLWIILITLIIVGACTCNFTELKFFGKIVTLMFSIIFAFCLILYLIIALTTRIDEANNKKQQEEYWEKVKQTPLIQWACGADGYQLHLAEHPQYVYQCSTGKLVAQSTTGLGEGPYWCESRPHKRVNHWKFCEHKANLSNSKYNNLLGK